MTTPQITCPKCGGAMKPGVAVETTWVSGDPDFPGDRRGVTVNPGAGKLIECRKCAECGWSAT